MMPGPLSVIPLITGACFLIAGWIMLKWPPKKINWYYGYRTSTAMKNQETWDFAQRYAAKELVKTAVLLIILGLLLSMVTLNVPLSLFLGVLLQLIVLIIMILRIEKAIKNRFS
ncbi:SdpI family protein [Robertkochia sediminum]|uniref:SdpI family protein n=1 Tax=Robertkochia sediminum TaxID=2785326 RepID=UPI0019342F7E|nr:SdpI family protein [Robertkochia sediminum]MBL7472568.1 SdpI family protein [Robertkochia sediminum]